MNKFRKGHWACCAEIHPILEGMKSHFTFHHVLLMQPEAVTKNMIPADGLMHVLLWYSICVCGDIPYIA
jgi:hypothetical protein